MRTHQIAMVSIDMLVPHAYRKFQKVFDFEKINYRLKKLEKYGGRSGYGIERLFKCLLYQFMEDLSDRQLEEALITNNVCRWFCDLCYSR